MSKVRIAVSGLALSAAAFIGLVTSEGYEEKAMIPTKGDRPTLGFGSTFHADGSAVKLGESTSPVRALVIAQAHLSKEETIFRKSLEAASLSQAEYDVYMNWVYQYGTGAWDSSSMRKAILAGQYAQACDALLLYKKSAGFDCSIPGNKVCAGVWTRQLQRNSDCKAAQ